MLPGSMIKRNANVNAPGPGRARRGARWPDPAATPPRKPSRRPTPPSPGRAAVAAARTTSIKRDAVIRAAARAFNERGYHNTSLDDIAAALGVTKPTVYYYVANKEQLLFECFRAGLEPIRTALQAADISGDSGRERLRRVIARLCARHRV